MKSIPWLISVLLISIGFSGCASGESGWNGTIEEVAGLTIVNNPLEPMYPSDVFSLEEELAIGTTKGDEAYMFTMVRSIAVDSDEKIYILDYKDNCVKIYDKSGEFVLKFGNQGEGPGEFYIPRKVTITENKEILVQNMRKFCFFSMEGEHLRDLSTSQLSLGSADFDSTGNIIGIDIVRDEENPRYELKKFDQDLNYLSSYDSSPLPNISMYGFNPFFPIIRWAVINGDQLVCGYMKEYVLNLYDAGGNLIKKITKEYKTIKVTQQDVDQSLEGEQLPPSILENMKVPEYHNPFRWLISDDEGRLFVMTYERAADGSGYYYDVFDPDGRNIARVPIKTRPDIIKNNKLYTIDEDEEGYQYVKRYKVTWDY